MGPLGVTPISKKVLPHILGDLPEIRKAPRVRNTRKRGSRQKNGGAHTRLDKPGRVATTGVY